MTCFCRETLKLAAVSSERPKVLSYLEGAVRIPIYKWRQFDRPAFPHHEPKAPSGGVVEAAGLVGDELQAGGVAVDDVLGRAEAPEPQVD